MAPDRGLVSLPAHCRASSWEEAPPSFVAWKGVGPGAAPEGGLQGEHGDCVLAPAPATCLLPAFLPGAPCISAGGTGNNGRGCGHPFSSLSLLHASALPTSHAAPVLSLSWPKSLSKEECWAPGSWPACHAAAGHPFLKHLLVEATGSRPLCHGSRTGRPAALLEFMMVDRVGVPSSPALRRPEGPLDVNFLSPYCSWEMSPERGCGSPKAAGQFRVEVELEPGAPSVFLRNQQDCPRRHHG